MGAVTRLYLSADDKGYVDVATADIDHFEDDLSVAARASLIRFRSSRPAAETDSERRGYGNRLPAPHRSRPHQQRDSC